jgi:hypothetical protein
MTPIQSAPTATMIFPLVASRKLDGTSVVIIQNVRNSEGLIKRPDIEISLESFIRNFIFVSSRARLRATLFAVSVSLPAVFVIAFIRRMTRILFLFSAKSTHSTIKNNAQVTRNTMINVSIRRTFPELIDKPIVVDHNPVVYNLFQTVRADARAPEHTFEFPRGVKLACGLEIEQVLHDYYIAFHADHFRNIYYLSGTVTQS